MNTPLALTGTAASASEHQRIEVEPQEDGRILCTCGKWVGRLGDDGPQWHCPRCKADVIVRRPGVACSYVDGVLTSTINNPSRLDLLAMLSLAEQISQSTRARMLEMLAEITDRTA